MRGRISHHGGCCADKQNPPQTEERWTSNPRHGGHLALLRCVPSCRSCPCFFLPSPEPLLPPLPLPTTTSARARGLESLDPRKIRGLCSYHSNKSLYRTASLSLCVDQWSHPEHATSVTDGQRVGSSDRKSLSPSLSVRLSLSLVPL